MPEQVTNLNSGVQAVPWKQWAPGFKITVKENYKALVRYQPEVSGLRWIGY